MKKIAQILFCLTLMLLCIQTAWAKDKYTVTVLPFTLHSSENIEYIRQGIADMLASRLSASDRIDVTSKDVVADLLKQADKKDLTPADVDRIGKQANADYVVWGSITKIGSSISIDGKLMNLAGAKSDVGVFTQSEKLDDVIPKINEFAQRIVAHITGDAAQVTMPAVAAQPVPTPAPLPTAAPLPAPGPSQESQLITGLKTGGKKATFTSMINPDFIDAADPMSRKGFWMSQKIRTEFKGMSIGDVNSDGKNEIVIIDGHNVYIYEKTSENLKLIKKISGKKYHNYVAVDVADINKNGIPEILVTVLNERTLVSFVLEYAQGEYKTIASDIRYFLRVIDTPSGIPLLLGQSYGMDKIFETQIYEILYRDGAYVSADKMKIPLGLSVYGLTLDTLGSGGDKIVALDELDYMCIIAPTTKRLSRILSFGFSPEELIWRSDEVYGGSNNYIWGFDRQKSSEVEPGETAFANLRILTHDTNKDGKNEIIIVKNLSSVGRVLKNVKLFSSSEVYNLQWDGLGMAENWRTKKINGYVADYAIRDVDGDGKPDLVLALVTSVGASISERSVIVIYQLGASQ